MSFSDPALILPGSVGETEHAAASKKNVASGVAGLDAYMALPGSVISALNLLLIGSTNIFTQSTSGTGAVTYTPSAGTVILSNPANSDDVSIIETDKIAPSLLPRLAVFRISNLTRTGAGSVMWFGFGNLVDGTGHQAGIYNSGATWRVITAAAASTTTDITTPAVGDVYIMYLTSARFSVFKNGAHLATHVTNLPTNAVGHFAGSTSGVGEGAGNQLGFSMMI